MCVLLVEDDFLIRLLMVECLRNAGFEVVEASNGDEAFALIDNPPKPLVMLVTDIHMPGKINGIHVANLVHERWPHVPVLVASARPDVFESRWKEDSRYSLLAKPFTTSQLTCLVEEAVSKSR